MHTPKFVVLSVAPLLLVALASCTSAPAPLPLPVTVTVQAPAPAAVPTTEAEPIATQVAPEPAAPVVEPAAAEVFTMPPVVGLNLQLAQDTLQALGSYLMDQQDASGLGRLQINDSNWQVCSQDPAPGAVVELSTTVTLASVKLSETCP